MNQCPLIEVLEHRIAPAGIVTASFIGSKLILSGDDASNQVTVSSNAPNSVLLTVAGGTVIQYEGINYNVSLHFNGNVTQLEARMGGGDDTLTISGLHGLGALVVDGENGINTTTLDDVICKGTLRFKGSNGKDVIKFQGDTVSAQSVSANLGGGDNEIEFSCALLEVRGLLNIVGGTGNDSVNMSSSLARLSSFSIEAGNGNNNIFLSPSTLTATGLLRVTSGTGNDTVFIDPQNLNSTNGITVTPGNGLDVVQITPENVMIGGGINVTLGKSVLNPARADISIVSGKINGGITLQAGDGNHEFTLLGTQNPHLGKLTITAGKGNDNVTFGGMSAQFSQILMNLGDGTNSATFGLPTLKTTGIDYTGGSGTDSVTLNGTYYDLGAIKMKGGAENDVFTANQSAGNSMQATSIAFDGGDGDDKMELRFENLVVINSIQFLGGNGDDILTLTGGAISAAGIVFTGGDGDDVVTEGHAFGNLSGALQINGGAGNNTLAIITNSFTAASINYTGTTGNDVITTIGKSLLVTGKTLLNLGSGANVVALSTDIQILNGGLTLNSGVGDDIAGFSGVSFKSGRISINSGAGTDVHRFTPSGYLAINGGLSVTTGAHSGLGEFKISSPNISLLGGVTAQLGDGANDCAIESNGVVTTTGNLAFRFTGAGKDTVSLYSLGSFQSQGAIQITGLQALLDARINAGEMLDLQNITITGGIGDDFAWISAPGGAIHGTVKVSLGDGLNSGIFGLETGGNLVLDKGANIGSKTLTLTDTFRFYNLTALGPMNIQMGSGVSTVTISNCDLQALSVSLGAGNDALNLDNSNDGIVEIIRGIAKITGGAGSDQFNLGDGTALGKVDFRSSVVLDGGTGTDVLDVLSNAVNLYIQGQPKILNFP